MTSRTLPPRTRRKSPSHKSLSSRWIWLTASCALLVLAVFLWADSPSALPARGAGEDSKHIPVQTVFEIVNGENRLARELYTKEIVGAGQKAGLKFSEEWRSPGVQAGPLPALFLRETAMRLEKDPVRLSLFLGSDYPISRSNLFAGKQTEAFISLRANQKPQFFYASDVQLYTGMFADLAVADTCVTCHNAHPQSPKKDWKLNDVMGAVTWLYPSETVSEAELLDILAALRKAIRESYIAYLEKTRTFENPPVVGEKWPKDGYFLPAADLFMEEFARRASPATVQNLLSIARTPSQITNGR